MRLIWLAAAGLPLAITIALDAQSAEVFESKVRPILAANCYDCHTDEHMGGLRLDSREALLKGGNSGQPAVVPGDPDKRTLIRRATLDLTGLPPSAEEIEAFEKDDAPDAFAKVIDRLLATPQYGETWGRLWLDVARYGEDDYRSLDPKGRGLNPYPNAYLYRDWVIKAFNDDMPYDQFVRAQIAGDLVG